ncbi:MAG: 50S ribosomal protein L25/general stress protein Ctc [Bacteroidales bacterium]|nr:50S ribosomal protein L25/general stress protein Ctc [Bacteroidales bacterium]
MKTIEIKAISRSNFGKKETKSLRAEDKVPCVMYGGKENLHFYAHENEFRSLIYTPDAHLISLQIDGKSYNAILKDLQFHPVSDKLLHIDFIQVSEDKPVLIYIPIKISGVSPGVKAGGRLKIIRRSLKIKGLTRDFPEHLDIDISNLEIGMSLKIGDLKYDNLLIMENKKSMIVAVATSRVVQKEETEAEVAPAAEGEEPAAEQAGA